jgi:hypothetical protein
MTAKDAKNAKSGQSFRAESLCVLAGAVRWLNRVT